MNIANQYRLTQSMRQYVLPCLIEVFGDNCAECLATHDSYEIDHIRYRDDINLYDLQLLCGPCHKAKTLDSNEAWLSRTSHCSTCTCYQD